MAVNDRSFTFNQPGVCQWLSSQALIVAPLSDTRAGRVFKLSRAPLLLQSHLSARKIIVILGFLGGLVAPVAWAQSSTLNDTIGNALLCLDALDPGYFYRYLRAEYGAPYQHQGGAWWFKTPQTYLWQVQINAILVGDEQGGLLFLAAETDVTPDKLAQAVTNWTGVRFDQGETGAHPVLVSDAGSKIAYSQTKSKIYCAQSRYLYRLP